MINSEVVLNRLNIPSNSPTLAVSTVGERLRMLPPHDAIKESVVLIETITNKKPSFEDSFVAVMTAQSIIHMLVQQGDGFDAEVALTVAEHRAHNIRNAPNNKWMFEQEVSVISPSTVQVEHKLIADIEVEFKPNGKMKKGEGQRVTEILYKRHVLDAEVPMTQVEFQHLLMDKMKLSHPHARTYSGNVKTKLGGEYAKPAPKAKKAA